MRKSLRRLQSIYTSTKINSDLCSFKVCRSLYRKKLLSTKSSYFTNLLCKYGTSSKQAYNLSFTLVGKSKPRHLPDQPDTVLCSSFANFFQNKVSNIIAALPNVNVDILTLNSYSLASHNHWFSFTLHTRPYVLSLMASLKSNSIQFKSTSPLDPIPLTLLRTLSPLLIEPITMIIHASLITSIVPNSMKHSYITPIIKKTTLSHSNLSSYRPISQLSSISKTLERIVSAQLIHYITTNSIIDKFQSAYLPHRSTESALNLIINDLLISLDNKAPCYLVLLDLSSAFDTLNHDILSLRLNEIGIHGHVHSWFMSFLSLRSSSVKINSSFSTSFISTHGVPQGSVLGPLLFIIYILPIQSIFRKYPYIHYHHYHLVLNLLLKIIQESIKITIIP